jgi:GH18 family chitinase
MVFLFVHIYHLFYIFENLNGKFGFLAEYVIGCYYTNWSQHRKEEVRFLPKNIDPQLCTHIYFAFANIDVDNMKLATFEKNDVSESGDVPVMTIFVDISWHLNI